MLSQHETDPQIAHIFREMSGIEKSHAIAFLEKNRIAIEAMPNPSGRARTLAYIGKIFGYDYVLGVLLDMEKSLTKGITEARKKGNENVSLSDTAHVKILQNTLNNNKVSGNNLARFEKRHRSVGGNALRAAVLGGNDGLVSNFSLVMGIAGATTGEKEVLLASLAGMLAGSW